MYKVLYRKYRPTNFNQIIGQDIIVKILNNAVLTKKISHSYLFCGPHGTGKTTMAKLFAKAINCKDYHSNFCCNKCENCLDADKNICPDIIEIDAASNNSVDNIRTIIDSVKFLPIKNKYKVYIIDEVHMLTTGAFNAFLKTLEEPPSHVIFILATTEPYKIPMTILSRCQRYDFLKINENNIISFLKEILKNENYTYELEAVKLIAQIADGSLRDALMMLDQLFSYSNKNQLLEVDVLKLFGFISKEKKINLLIKIANKNTLDVLNDIDSFFEKGINIKNLINSFIDILKETLIFHITNEISLLKVINENDANKLKKIFNIEQINKMIKILIETEFNLKNLSNVKSLFEITILKLITLIN